MKRLPPQKRNKLILVIVGTLAVVGLVYFFMIGPQNEENKRLAAGTNAKASELSQIKKLIKQADATAVTAGDITTLLNHAEEDTAAGDVFAWTYDTMRQFKVNRHIDITTIGQPTQSDVDIIPNFPYKQIRFQIIGSGYYHDIGKFVSDLENKFPHMRIVNITIDTTLGSDAVNERLSFRMEVAALVKPTA
jgi:Tfp pilus assembly protein PilO